MSAGTPCAECGEQAVGADGFCGSCGMEQQAAPRFPRPPQSPPSSPPSPRPSSETTGTPATSGTATGGTSATTGTGTTGTGTTGSRPAQPPGTMRPGDDDPTELLLPHPSLPERKRFCRNPMCRRDVGRARDGQPGRPVGFCQECGWPFDFRPPLAPGTVVAARYEVRGAIGRGGLGWIHLARDTRLSRWVVLKGLSEPELPDAGSVFGSELEALLEAEGHPNMVAVYDQVVHDHRLPGLDGKIVGIEYIVMELVRGRTLRAELHRRLREKKGFLPPAEVCELMADALAGLGYLHDHGLIYNDFSDDNVMRAADGRVRNIDLGAVSKLGVVQIPQRKEGYADPAEPPPSVQADLFAVGRTALRLTVDVPDFRKGGLPDPADVELFRRFTSFHLLLARATDPDPGHRFGSAEEMADAFRAVGREILSLDGHGPRRGRSIYFGGGRRAVGDDPDAFPAVTADRATIALALPELQVDVTDRHAGRLTAMLGDEPDVVRALLGELADPSPESRLLAVRVGLRLAVENPTSGGTPSLDELRAELDDLEASTPDRSWPASFVGRVAWVRGVAELALGSVETARAAFGVALRRMPGEPAPKLGIAHCAELLDDRDEALRHFDVVWRTDRSWVSAAFGVARCETRAGRRDRAESALSVVPALSRHATNAALCALGAAGPQHDLDAEQVRRWFARAERLDPEHPDPLDVDERRREQSIIAVLETCRGWVGDGRAPAGDPPDGAPDTVLGVPLTARGLGDGLERAHRNLARLPGPAATRRAHVDEANRVRNWSLW